MQFVNPSFLFALFAIAIPIIIHLFNFRRFKKIYFPNVQFLKNIKQETQSKSRLRHLLVLLTRILAIVALVLAFAQPYIPLSNTEINFKQKAISVYIDNSFSMEAVTKSGTLLDEAKKQAVEVVSAYKPTDEFQLLSNDFEGKHQRLLSRDEFVEQLQEIKISPAVRNISEVVSRQQSALSMSNATEKQLYILSDFQKSNSDFNKVRNNRIALNLIPIKASQTNNLYIDSCWFYSKIHQVNQTDKLFVRVKNTSDKPLENIPIKLFINEKQKALGSITIAARSETEITLPFTNSETGIQYGRVELMDYPIVFDDKFFISFHVAEMIHALSINDDKESPYLTSLFSKDSSVTLENISDKKINSSVPNYTFIVLNELKTLTSGLSQELNKFVLDGGSLLIFPSALSDISAYKNFLSPLQSSFFERLDTADIKVDKINLSHPVYADVFEKIPENMELPIAFSHFVLSKNTRSTQDFLLRLQNGENFLSEQQCGKGKLYLCVSGLSAQFSNFAKQAIFVPTLYKMALYSVPTSKLFFIVGSDEMIEVNNQTVSGENVFKIKSTNTDFSFIPEHRLMNGTLNLMVHNQINVAGLYSLQMGNKALNGLAYNYNRKESDMQFLAEEEMEKALTTSQIASYKIFNAENDTLKKTIIEMNQGKKLWKICLILALLFLAAEIALIRLLK